MAHYIPVYKIQVVKEASFRTQAKQIRCAEDAAEIFSAYLDGLDREHFVVMTLDTKHRVTGLHTVSVGSLDAAIVHPREVYKLAVMSNSSAIIVSHLHPSGDPTASNEDLLITRRLVEAGKILGIDVLDHIIVGDEGSFLSLKSQGQM